MKIVSLIVAVFLIFIVLWYYVKDVNTTTSKLNTSDENYIRNAEKAVEKTNEHLKKQAEELERLREE